MNGLFALLLSAMLATQQQPLPGDVNCPRPAGLEDAAHQADLYCMANAIYFESRGEPIEGQEAVAWTVASRVNSLRYEATTICEVVWQSGQFSFVNDGLCNYPKTDSPQWESALELANFVLSNSTDSPFPATFFVNHAIANPAGGAWIKNNKTFLVTIGQHSFYSELGDLISWCSNDTPIETISLTDVALQLHQKYCTGALNSLAPGTMQAEAAR